MLIDVSSQTARNARRAKCDTTGRAKLEDIITADRTVNFVLTMEKNAKEC